MDEMEIVEYRQIDGLTLFLNTVEYRTAHFHPEWELMWVLRNSLIVACGQTRFRLEPGEMVLFAPNEPHEFHKDAQSCTFLCLQLSGKQFRTPQMALEDRFPDRHLTPERQRWLRQTLRSVAKAYFSKEPHYELFCLGQSCLILHHLLTSLPCRALTPEEIAGIDRRNARLKRFIRFVDENYMHKIRLSDFAAQEQCSLSYLSHFVKDATNQTFQEYVNSVRFHCACRLIAAGKTRMLDVCTESGFSDYRYFSRAFRQQYGVTPEEYSLQLRQLPLENAAVRHSLHSIEQFYTREESLRLLKELSE